MKRIVAVLAGIFFANFAYAQDQSGDCDCGHNPFVKYELNVELEFDENPWRVISIERFDVDLTQEDEADVCIVHLELIPHTEPILYNNIQDVPDNDQELYWNGQWVLMSEFENQMDESSCSFEGAMS